jgi:hypothetical protein
MNESDLKFSKVSKRVRDLKAITMPVLTPICPIRVLSTPCLKRNLEVFISRNKSITDVKRQRLSYSDLTELFGAEKNCDHRVIKAEKATQTENCKIDKNQKPAISPKLKAGWISRVDNRGVSCYINLIDGTSVYDLRLAKEKTPTKPTTYENFYNLVKEKHFFQSNIVQSAFQQDIKLRREILNRMNEMIHHNVLVKWRHLDELKILENLANISDLESNDLKFMESVKFDKKIFKNLKVCIFYFKKGHKNCL